MILGVVSWPAVGWGTGCCESYLAKCPSLWKGGGQLPWGIYKTFQYQTSASKFINFWDSPCVKLWGENSYWHCAQRMSNKGNCKPDSIGVNGDLTVQCKLSYPAFCMDRWDYLTSLSKTYMPNKCGNQHGNEVISTSGPGGNSPSVSSLWLGIQLGTHWLVVQHATARLPSLPPASLNPWPITLIGNPTCCH